MAYYFVSGVVVSKPGYFQIMEEAEGKQVCIATVPFNGHLGPQYNGRDAAYRDAQRIAAGLNMVEAAALTPKTT